MKLIAIEGIDRLGKSTFINELQKRFQQDRVNDKNDYPIIVEKPTIGLNTIDKNDYPLKDIKGIFEYRNIGLFEEFLFQTKIFNTTSRHNKCVIRDRFHLSELAYGTVLRYKNFDVFSQNGDFVDGMEVYAKWNAWFEEKLQEVNKDTYLIVFNLSVESPINEDEVAALTPEVLRQVNYEFVGLYRDSKIKNKKLVNIEIDPETGLSNIMDYLDEVYNFVK